MDFLRRLTGLGLRGRVRDLEQRMAHAEGALQTFRDFAEKAGK